MIGKRDPPVTLRGTNVIRVDRSTPISTQRGLPETQKLEFRPRNRYIDLKLSFAAQEIKLRKDYLPFAQVVSGSKGEQPNRTFTPLTTSINAV